MKKKAMGDEDAPVATKSAPTLSAPTHAENKSHDEDMVGPKRSNFESTERKTTSLPKFRKLGSSKSEAALVGKMRNPTLLKYVVNKVLDFAVV